MPFLLLDCTVKINKINTCTIWNFEVFKFINGILYVRIYTHISNNEQYLYSCI